MNVVLNSKQKEFVRYIVKEYNKFREQCASDDKTALNPMPNTYLGNFVEYQTGHPFPAELGLDDNNPGKVIYVIGVFQHERENGCLDRNKICFFLKYYELVFDCYCAFVELKQNGLLSMILWPPEDSQNESLGFVSNVKKNILVPLEIPMGDDPAFNKFLINAQNQIFMPSPALIDYVDSGCKTDNEINLENAKKAILLPLWISFVGIILSNAPTYLKLYFGEYNLVYERLLRLIFWLCIAAISIIILVYFYPLKEPLKKTKMAWRRFMHWYNK